MELHALPCVHATDATFEQEGADLRRSCTSACARGCCCAWSLVWSLCLWKQWSDWRLIKKGEQEAGKRNEQKKGIGRTQLACVRPRKFCQNTFSTSLAQWLYCAYLAQAAPLLTLEEFDGRKLGWSLCFSTRLSARLQNGQPEFLETLLLSRLWREGGDPISALVLV